MKVYQNNRFGAPSLSSLTIKNTINLCITTDRMKTYCTILLTAFTTLASAQQNNVSSRLEVLDVTNGSRTVVKEFPYRVEAPNWTPDGQ